MTHQTFFCIVQINLVTEEDAKVWIEKMSEHSMCIYRTKKTVTPCKKRVQCKFVKHCQHFAKKLSPKQAEKSALSTIIKDKTPLTSQIQSKKTNCHSSFTFVIQIPSKLYQRKAESQPYLLSHCGVLKMNFSHNHPSTAAHTLSFRDVSPETKKNWQTYLIWVTVPPLQGMLMNRDYCVKQNLINKS